MHRDGSAAARAGSGESGQLREIRHAARGSVRVAGRCSPTVQPIGYIPDARYILVGMSKHLIDLDEGALSAARTELGTTTIKDTVNEALRRTVEQRHPRVIAALD